MNPVWSGRPLALQLLEKPSAGVNPEKVRAPGRDPEGLGRFPNCEAREVAKLDQFGSLSVGRSEFRQGLVQRQHFVRPLWGSRVESIDLDPLPISATLEAALLPGLIDQDAAHRFGGSGKEVAAAVPMLISGR